MVLIVSTEVFHYHPGVVLGPPNHAFRFGESDDDSDEMLTGGGPPSRVQNLRKT